MTQWKLSNKLLLNSILLFVILLSSCDKELNTNVNYLINKGAFKDCKFKIIEKYDVDEYQIKVKCQGQAPELYRATYRDLLKLMYRI